jgi:6-phosphogluconate dehydrogenase
VLRQETQILDHPDMVEKVKANYMSLVNFVVETLPLGVAIPCHAASLQYMQTYAKALSSANMIQAQRDYFGAHTYERIDDASGKKYHTIWNA